VQNKFPKVYAFIDSQNLNLGVSKDINKKGKLVYKDWKLDMVKFHRYLSEKFRVQKAILFIGYLENYRDMYKSFKQYGYDIVFKPTVRNEFGKAKGNVDAEIVLYSSAIMYKDYDIAIVVSGDGDFYCLYKFLKTNNKLKNILIPNKFSQSTLLKEFEGYKEFLYRDKKLLEK